MVRCRSLCVCNAQTFARLCTCAYACLSAATCMCGGCMWPRPVHMHRLVVVIRAHSQSVSVRFIGSAILPCRLPISLSSSPIPSPPLYLALSPSDALSRTLRTNTDIHTPSLPPPLSLSLSLEAVLVYAKTHTSVQLLCTVSVLVTPTCGNKALLVSAMV